MKKVTTFGIDTSDRNRNMQHHIVVLYQCFGQIVHFNFLKKYRCIFFGWVLCHTNTVKVIRQLSSFTGGGRPSMHEWAPE